MAFRLYRRPQWHFADIDGHNGISLISTATMAFRTYRRPQWHFADIDAQSGVWQTSHAPKKCRTKLTFLQPPFALRFLLSLAYPPGGIMQHAWYHVRTIQYCRCETPSKTFHFSTFLIPFYPLPAKSSMLFRSHFSIFLHDVEDAHTINAHHPCQLVLCGRINDASHVFTRTCLFPAVPCRIVPLDR